MKNNTSESGMQDSRQSTSRIFLRIPESLFCFFPIFWIQKCELLPYCKDQALHSHRVELPLLTSVNANNRYFRGVNVFVNKSFLHDYIDKSFCRLLKSIGAYRNVRRPMSRSLRYPLTFPLCVLTSLGVPSSIPCNIPYTFALYCSAAFSSSCISLLNANTKGCCQTSMSFW